MYLVCKLINSLVELGDLSVTCWLFGNSYGVYFSIVVIVVEHGICEITHYPCFMN